MQIHLQRNTFLFSTACSLKYFNCIKKILLILVLLAFNIFTSSQTNFVKAVVIDNNRDSIYGTIDYRNWKNNPQTINFINAANSKMVYDASSVKGFYVPSVYETYTSYTVEMDMIPGDQDKAINSSFIDSPTITKKVFLLLLVKHTTLRLYQYIDSYKEHFYYVKEDEQPVELIHHYVYDESRKQVKENFTYKDQLSRLFASCQGVVDNSKTIKFRKKEIQGIFLKYLQCIAPGSPIEVKKKDQDSFKFGIVAGIMFNNFKFEGSNSALVDENYSSNVSPVLGVSFDVGLSRNRNKWHIVNEIIYKSYKTGSSFTRPYGSGYTLKSDVDVNFSYAQLNTILRYLFQSDATVKPYINLGIGNAFIFSQRKNNLHKVYSFGTEENVKAFDGPNNYELSLLGGAGIAIHNILIEFRYGRSKKGFSGSEDLDVNPQMFQFLFTYQF